MSPTRLGNVLNWASLLEENTLLQAQKSSRMPFVKGHVALMPDAHLGIGATVGSVIPTEGAIIPAAVGVDIGCGMAAAKLPVTASQLPDDLQPLLIEIEHTIPAGVGKGRDKDLPGAGRIELPRSLRDAVAFKYMDGKLRSVSGNQLGTLGSGNHFVELCLDEGEGVWIVLHSGSRGVGNKLAQHHIKIAKGLMRDWFIKLEDQDLAYLVQGTPEFDAYIADMLWAQDYARENRDVMLAQAVGAFVKTTGLHFGKPTQVINCHHNFTKMESHHGRNMWITRKGAISARDGQWGIIPGSMGTATYIVTGKGNEASYTSCSHGAGRRLSRSAARKELTVESLDTAMEGKTWNNSRAGALLDEHPDSYKDIDVVMADQEDLVSVEHTLHQVLNYKGT